MTTPPPSLARPAAVLAGLVVLLGGWPVAAQQTAGTGNPSIFDHHVHLLSPALVRDWKSLGVPFSRPDSVYTSVAGLLATPGFDGAWVLSMGYLYSSAMFRDGLALDDEREYAAVRRENDHVAAEVRRAPHRLVGFCGVNPLRPHARRELARCRDTLGLGGIKLHLANTRLDPSNPVEVEAVAAVAAWAESGGLPLLLHLDPMRAGLEVADLESLLARVIDSHPRLDLVVAHVGGSGGYGEWTRRLAPAIARRAGNRPGRLSLEVSGAVLERETEGVPPTTAAEAAALAADLRRLGLDHVVFGSDYPLFDPLDYQATLRSRVPLTRAELDSIFANRPYARNGRAAP